MPLAIAGLFEPLLALPLMLLVAGAAWWRWKLPLGAAEREARLAGIAAVVVVAVVAGVNGKFGAQHLLAERDPGVYTVTGEWLAQSGDLRVETDRDEFGRIAALGYAATGFNASGRGDYLEPQFMHLLPVTLAVASWAGGWDLLLAASGVLGALALLMIYLFASRFMRPAFALGAIVAVGVSLPQVYFSRDSYSEPLAQILLFGGLWALWEATDHPSRGASFVAGLVLGATFLARIDALLTLVIIGGFLLLDLARTRAKDSGAPVPPHTAFFVAGLLPPAAIAAADLALIAPFYYEGLRGEAEPLIRRIALVAIAGGLVLALGRFIGPLVARLRPLRNPLAWALAAITLVGGVYETIERPWLVWYLGIVPVALGVAGLALGWRRALDRPGMRPLALFLLIVMGTATVYLLRPSITQEQIWGMRRFLPIVVPGVMIGAFLLLDMAWARWGGQRVAVRAALAVAGLGVIAFPAARLAPVADARTQFPMKHATATICDRLPKNAAVLVLPGGSSSPIAYTLSSQYIVTLRAFCDVPAASAPLKRSVIDRAAAEVAKRGRTLMLMSQSRVPYPPPGPPPEHLGAIVEELERPLDRPPKLSHEINVEIFLVPAQ